MERQVVAYRNKHVHFSLPSIFLFLSILSLLVSSCSTPMKRKDGPPNFYVDENAIPNAVPKPEPLAKLGNMPSYRVFGKRYYVMSSGKNYEATGTASWYGTLFHKRRTSSGEPYNMLSMTAAHKTLPLPTYVEVTNLANQRRVIVKVNDRGPFSGNRLIDLSYVAAKKLGMVGRGTAHVKIKTIDPYAYQRSFFSKSSPPYHNIWQANRSHSHIAQKKSATNSPTAARAVYLQVGAFRNKLNALKMRQRLQTLLSTPIIVSSDKPSGQLYRVQIGPIYDLLTANKISNRLRDLGIQSNKRYGA